MSFKKTVFLVFSVVLISVCLNSVDIKASESHEHHKTNHSPKSDKSRKAIAKIDKQAVINVLIKNEVLHQSFFDYNGEEVEKSARALYEEIDKIKKPEIKKLLAFSQKKLKEIKNSNSRELNNEIYNIVSTALIYLVNTYDLGAKYNAYSCPMVKKKWIQNSVKILKIKNPYAPEMPHCGSKDTNY
jgi:hypothetical protein